MKKTNKPQSFNDMLISDILNWIGIILFIAAFALLIWFTWEEDIIILKFLGTDILLFVLTGFTYHYLKFVYDGDE